MQTAAEPATSPAIELWLGFPPAPALAVGLVELAGPDSFAVFDAMRAAGVGDVRRVGVVCTDPAHVVAARAAGAGAVVAVGDARTLAAAAPDVLAAPGELDELVEARYGPNGTARRLVLLNPGPALTSDAVKRAAAGADICHREPEFRGLDRRIREKLRRLAGVGPDWAIALLSGSGTSANEAAIRAAVREGRRLLVVVNGIYGERLRETARRAGIDAVSVEGPWTEPVDVASVLATLGSEPALDALAIVHHETTTGLLNPVAEIARAASAAGVRTVVDAISSFGVEDLALDGIDFLTCTSNKCLHGLPGAAFVLVSPSGARRARSVETGSVALDLAAYLDVETTGSPPFTPAIPALASLDAALDRALAEGVAGRRARYAERCAIVDGTVERLGLEQLVAPPARSHSIRSVRLPDGVSFATLHERLRAAGFVVYAGQGPLAAEIFRVACMGELEPSDLHRFAAELEQTLSGLQA
ncbi:MAG TPA: aminotransferase class V-fold PLP-dependent enzyme [Gaiellaceae bacterium]|nr:aminotransferase class V-fold PLP-dependent enzyme [Gaiellaceae bacterium]